MDWDWIATMVMIMVVVATVGGVVLLFPVSRRLGALLEAMTQERRNSPEVRSALTRVRRSVEALEDRLELLEEKQDFTEKLLDDRNRRRLERGAEERGEKDSDPGSSGPSD